MFYLFFNSIPLTVVKGAPTLEQARLCFKSLRDANKTNYSTMKVGCGVVMDLDLKHVGTLSLNGRLWSPSELSQIKDTTEVERNYEFARNSLKELFASTGRQIKAR